MRLHLSTWLPAAAGVLLLPALVTAEDDSAEGVVRLGSARQSAIPAGSYDAGAAQQVGFHAGYNGGCSDGACGQGCGAGYGCPSACGSDSGCPSGCQTGCGYGSCDPCGCGSCGDCKVCGVLQCLRCRPVGGCHYSPDHGWAPPGKHPRPRTAATYRRWFPGSWTGEGSYAESGYLYPMVYTPTDTTQLGYYHQRVPVWQHRAGMIPPVPHPDQFHVPNFGVCCNGGVDAAACGYCGNGQYGAIVSDYAIGETYSDGQGAFSAPAESAPVEPQPAPAAAPAQDAKPESYVPPAPAAAPEAPPAAGTNAPSLEKSALAPFLYPTPQR
ncbi:MAG: hypothetical protein AB7U20_09950 [Planctomycetaceae bacterium]